MGSVFTSLAASGLAQRAGLGPRAIVVALIALTIWSLVWKGIALWFSARNYQKGWFIILLILNTGGIADIIYLVFFRADKQEGVTKSLFNNPIPEPAREPEVV